MSWLLSHAKRATAAAALALLAPCPATAAGEFELNILHINDHHSHLEPNTLELQLGGRSTRVEAGGFARVVAMMKMLAGDLENVVKLHAGDALTGSIYYSVFGGKADAALMNEICFDAFALGNHEFDDGDAGLAGFLAELNPPDGTCDTPVLAANVAPARGTPLSPADGRLLIRPWTLVERGERLIGVIGIDIAGKTVNSSSPLPSTQFLDEYESAQSAIDAMTRAGIGEIVLLTHIQYRRDIDLARRLRGVDVIVGGDSHTLLGDEFSMLGLNVGGPYPTVVENADGEPVCIVQAWEYSNVVGHLRVRFDGDGRVQSCRGTPYLLIGDRFYAPPADGGDAVELEGLERDATLTAIEAMEGVTIVPPDPDALRQLDRFTDQIADLKHTVIGEAGEVLCQERVPGEGRSAVCPCERTAGHGGDIQQVVADAFLARSYQADIALQNAGGVRIDLDQGPVTVDHAYTLLPFSNTLVNLEMRGMEIRRVLEEAVAHVLDDGGSSGAWPYAAGLRWTVDMSAPAGKRLSDLEFRQRGGAGWTPLDADATYTVTTNSFLASGRDGYATLARVAADGRLNDTGIEYAEAFVDFLGNDAGGRVARPPAADYSNQRVLGQGDRVGNLLTCAAR